MPPPGICNGTSVPIMRSVLLPVRANAPPPSERAAELGLLGLPPVRGFPASLVVLKVRVNTQRDRGKSAQQQTSDSERASERARSKHANETIAQEVSYFRARCSG